MSWNLLWLNIRQVEMISKRCVIEDCNKSGAADMYISQEHLMAHRSIEASRLAIVTMVCVAAVMLLGTLASIGNGAGVLKIVVWLSSTPIVAVVVAWHVHNNILINKNK